MQIKELEEEVRAHGESSSVLPSGRVNVSHAKKKKRIDAELEKALELLEQKRDIISSIENSTAALTRQKECRDSEVRSIEKKLLSNFIETEKLLVSLVEDLKMIEHKGKNIIKLAQFPWPPIENPSLSDAAFIKIED